MRCILIGVCILSGYGLVKASDQVDTINLCYQEGLRIMPNIVDAEFHNFLEGDSIKVYNYTKQYEPQIEYTILTPKFSGDGIDDDDDDRPWVMGIGNVTSGLRNQYINCTITYLRKIHFKKSPIDDSCYNLENAIQKNDLLGEPQTGSYPDFELNSIREWHAVICIRKSNKRQWEVKISGDTCVDDAKIFSIPDTFQDMTIEWFCGGEKIPNAKSCQMSFSKNVIPGNALTTLVRCEIKMCTNETLAKDSIRIRLKKTPASTLSFEQCLPTSSKFIRVKASNRAHGVKFQWDKEGLDPLLPLSATSQTVDYPVSTLERFTIKLTTSGGCESTPTQQIVYRKLSNNVTLQESDSCLISGTPFIIATVPPLPATGLQWTTPADFQTLVIPSDNGIRKDRIRVNRLGTSNIYSTITVTDIVCGGSISKTIIVSPYTEMTAKGDDGKTIADGDTIKDTSVKKITFIAPQHSSITGDEPYNWSTKRYIPANKYMPARTVSTLPMPGTAEFSTDAPASGGGYIEVTVSYTSCRGYKSQTYTIHSN